MNDDLTAPSMLSKKKSVIWIISFHFLGFHVKHRWAKSFLKKCFVTKSSTNWSCPQKQPCNFLSLKCPQLVVFCLVLANTSCHWKAQIFLMWQSQLFLVPKPSKASMSSVLCWSKVHTTTSMWCSSVCTNSSLWQDSGVQEKYEKGGNIFGVGFLLHKNTLSLCLSGCRVKLNSIEGLTFNQDLPSCPPHDQTTTDIVNCLGWGDRLLWVFTSHWKSEQACFVEFSKLPAADVHGPTMANTPMMLLIFLDGHVEKSFRPHCKTLLWKRFQITLWICQCSFFLKTWFVVSEELSILLQFENHPWVGMSCTLVSKMTLTDALSCGGPNAMSLELAGVWLEALWGPTKGNHFPFISKALALETIPIIYYKSVTLCCLVWQSWNLQKWHPHIFGVPRCLHCHDQDSRRFPPKQS